MAHPPKVLGPVVASQACGSPGGIPPENTHAALDWHVDREFQCMILDCVPVQETKLVITKDLGLLLGGHAIVVHNSGPCCPCPQHQH